MATKRLGGQCGEREEIGWLGRAGDKKLNHGMG